MSVLDKLLQEDAAAQEEKKEQGDTPQEQPKAEEKVVEETKTESVEPKAEKQEAIDNKDSSLKETETTETTTVVDDFEDRFKERLEKEGYVPKEEYEKLKQPPTQNEIIQRMLELEKAGHKIDKASIPELFEDFSKYDVNSQKDALSLMRRKLRKELGDDESAEWKVNKKYKALFEEDSDSEEYKDALMELRIDAKNALKEFQGNQEKLAIPNSSNTYTSKEQILEELQYEASARQEKIRDAFSQMAESATKDFSEVKYNVFGEDVNLEVTSEQKRELKKELKNLDTFFDRNFMNDKGEIDQQGIAKLIFLHQNQGKIMEVLAGEFKSKGKEEEFNSRKNTTKQNSTQAPPPNDNDFHSQLARSIVESGQKIW